jgi:hypothetical protein
VTLFIGIKSFDQDSKQLIEQTLGRFEYRADLNDRALPPGGTDTPEDLADVALSNGAEDAAVVFQSYDVRPATTERRFTVYLESDWTKNPFPDRYRLESGRWPRAAGEVVVTEGYLAAAPDIQSSQAAEGVTSVLSGNASFRVVGRVTDVYATKSSRILAASGTWASLDAATLSERYPTLSASASLYWSGGVPGGLADAINGTQPPANPTLDPIGDPNAVVATADVLSTSSSTLRDPHSFITSIPLAYSIPSFLLPAIAAMVAYGLNARRLRRSLGILRSVGVSGKDASTSVILASFWWQVMAVLLGSLVGVLGGLVARGVAASFATRPLAPFANPISPAARILAITTLCAGVALACLIANQKHVGAAALMRPLLKARRFASPTRRALGTLTLAIGFIQAIRLDSIPGVMLLVLTFAVGVALYTPDVLPRAISTIPARNAPRRLALRQLVADIGRAQTATITVATTLGLSLAMLILLQSLTTSESEGHFSMTSPGQVSLISGGGGLSSAPATALTDLAAASIGDTQPPIDVGFAYGESPERLAHIEGDPNGIILVVNTSAEASRLANGQLTTEAQKVLDDGGLVLWKTAPSPRRLVLIDPTTETIVATTPAVQTAVQDYPANWMARAAGIMLRSQAQKLGLPTSHSQTVFTDVDGDRAHQVRAAAMEAGYDLSQVGIYEPPRPVVPPLAYWGGAIGLALALLLAIAAVARAQALSLRAYLGGLVALGISARWAQKVLRLQILVITGVGATTGMALAVAPIAYSSFKIPGLTLSLPWGQITLLLTLFVTAGGSATWQASRRLRANDRHAL